ncbi:MAG: M3 family oligoendopeptidase [Spirochaetaceae bacterium]|jgi:pepF/M3 family oligoendopeptidase|nr:M3 family oligoendopeptidase [Spirochaetaceae bacterium]
MIDTITLSGGGSVPRWKLSAIYPSFDAPEYVRDTRLLREQIGGFLAMLENPLPADGAELLKVIRAFEAAENTAGNLETYAEAVYTTNTQDARALAEINAVKAAALPLGKAGVIFRRRLAEQKDHILKLTESDPVLGQYRFFLTESIEKAGFQMAPELEDLANDLSRSGGDAWSRLHESISSTVQVLWNPATGERKTVTALRDLAHNPDRNVREQAYKAELAAWKSVEIPLAAALNGVKGAAITLDTRRGWKTSDGGYDMLKKSSVQSRITEKTLKTLIAALEDALPLFRRYLKTKARLLGIPVCGFYDLFAPTDIRAKKWTWEETAEFIPNRFDEFDPGMGAFARHAFAFSWIDAEPREGKVGGAYCTDFPLTGESRILCNFEGSFDSVTTVAHELGHAWHHELLKDLPRSLAQYPMTLAETASIFAETLVFEGALQKASPEERLGLIEGNLKDACQVIVDILSRFYFEEALFKRRAAAELHPTELCALMLEAQRKTYGDGLDPSILHPYMWAVKSHYYRASLGFYNYPYAFGLLFSLGLYAEARKKGPSFAQTYRDMLRLTGKAPAETAAQLAGFSIEDESFWRQGIGVIAQRLEELENKPPR